MTGAEIFPLWSFGVRMRGIDFTVLTRGRTQEEAASHMHAHFPDVVWHQDIGVDAARQYSRNHAPGWLQRPMHWLEKQRAREGEARVLEHRFAGGF